MPSLTGRILVLGTRNAKKRGELQRLLGIPWVELRTLAEYPHVPEVQETGSTFAENAALKATTLARALGQWVLGEDSGLCVDALGGRPGIYSARYAGAPCDDEKNNDKLLEEMRSVAEERRTAHYICAAVLSDPRGEVRGASEGRCDGRITRERRGGGGFGYDPLFLIPETGRTFGELPAEYKQTHSHRSKAMTALRPQIMSLIECGRWSP